jgi:ATP-binding cassette, subfamily B, bacterial
VIDLIDTPVRVPEPARPTALAPGPIEIGFEDVGFAYPGGPPVLAGVTFTVPVGVHAAVVGETGSGKTTIARLLTRQVDPTSGRVLLGGTDRRCLAGADLAGRVVLVPQEGFLFEGTIAANIGFGGHPERVAATVARLGLQPWLAGLPLGADTPVGQRGEALSAGERQLVALARACHVDPDLLVLDEATSAVDPGTEVMLQHALAVATRGRSSVTIAHRLSTAEAADLVIVVAAGRVVATGSHSELLHRSPDYRRLHQGWVRRSGRIEA